MTVWGIVFLLSMLAACQSKPEISQVEPVADNAFTQHVDRGVSTMNKADVVVSQMNAGTADRSSQAQSVGEP